MKANRDPLDPTRLSSEGGAPEHRAALAINCRTCLAVPGAWCILPIGATWALCSERINDARDGGSLWRQVSDRSHECLARCTSCGWTGIAAVVYIGWDLIERMVNAAIDGGVEIPAINRCPSCKTGEAVEARGEMERLAAMCAHVGQTVPGVVTRMFHERREVVFVAPVDPKARRGRRQYRRIEETVPETFAESVAVGASEREERFEIVEPDLRCVRQFLSVPSLDEDPRDVLDMIAGVLLWNIAVTLKAPAT